MAISTIKDCERLLAPYIPDLNHYHEGGVTTDRALSLAKAAGSPHEKLRIIHAAGTSGKTSTCYFIASLLGAGGCKVGLTVTPHITSITERVQINGEPLREGLFVEYFSEFYKIVQNANVEDLSYFEFLMIFSLWVFEKEKVDYAVVETGLGGLHDASNICTREDKVAVITDIGLDHTNILGDTLTEIAGQKAGIIWPGNHVFCYRQSPEVDDVIAAESTRKNATLHRVLSVEPDEESDVPVFQQRNWILAKSAYDFIRDRDNLQELSAAELVRTLHTNVPARMELHTLNNKVLIVDGAHNEQKMTTFFNSFVKRFPGVEPVILLALKEGKELQAVAPIIARFSKEVIVTEFTKEQDMPLGAMKASVVAKALEASGVSRVVVRVDVNRALSELLASKNDTLLVIGSFFLAAEVRPLLQEISISPRMM
ncbi:MAG TPA: Mur ligase family protein [Candidatus Saccharimonadales bacterium]